MHKQVEAGADVLQSRRGGEGVNVLMNASYQGRASMVARLLERLAPADIDARVRADDVGAGREEWVGATALYCAAKVTSPVLRS